MKLNPNEWRPTEKQSLFLSIPLTVEEAFYAGALHAGKTDVLLLYPILNRWHENPEFKGIFLRRTFPELKKEVIPRSQRLFRAVGGKYNKNDHIWEFNTGLNHSRSPQGVGALFYFCHCENEDDVRNYDSSEPNYAAFDELTSFTEWQYLYIALQRVRRKLGSSLPMIVRSGSNPGNTGHSWVRKRFIDPCPEGGKIIKGPSGIKRIFIPATVYDNPYTDPAYLRKLEALPEAEKQAKLYGRWDAYEGSVFNEFRDRRYPDEPENALHVIDSFDILEWWPKLVIGDWGMRAMTWIGYLAIAPNKRVYLYREQTFRGMKIEEWVPYVKYFVDMENPRSIRFCKSAGQDRGQEHTIQQQISSALDRPVELSNSSAGSRVSGKNLLHEYLRWRQKHVFTSEISEYNEDQAMWIFRNRSVEEYHSYMNSFAPPEEETNLPKLQIFKTCNEEQKTPEVVNAIKACVYAKDQEGKQAEDVAEFKDDDPYDGLRYGLDGVERFFAESSDEFMKMQKREELMRTLANTGNWTAFYRNMEKSESSSGGTRPVSRYHH